MGVNKTERGGFWKRGSAMEEDVSVLMARWNGSSRLTEVTKQLS